MSGWKLMHFSDAAVASLQLDYYPQVHHEAEKHVLPLQLSRMLRSTSMAVTALRQLVKPVATSAAGPLAGAGNSIQPVFKYQVAAGYASNASSSGPGEPHTHTHKIHSPLCISHCAAALAQAAPSHAQNSTHRLNPCNSTPASGLAATYAV